ncbi:UDP-N-acetylmuramoyl-tripeptide--D-alanyl-D-alanine ligase [Candidatus Daviesbacteria bacterium]|nr:UDP-N-acetylmuramoyl-tripeptide--D-alanyl-D-alanine ligase [Candidatus Daviesbacteria bacterium]
MSKFINTLFPFFDHLYIFQLLEYEIPSFLIWFLKHPSKRNLQRKHKLVFTQKTLAITIIGLGLLVLVSASSAYSLFYDLVLTPFFIIFYGLFSPIFIISAQVILSPFEEYSKNKLLKAASEKVRSLPNLKKVAIVGSFAKTSTKNMLYTLLWKDFIVVKTPKSFNTPISVARTIMEDLKKNTEVFIVEMDAYHPGEIKKLAYLIEPDMAIITAIAPQHLERFGSMDILAKTQFEVVSELKKDGLLILNSSDDWTMKLHQNYKINKVFFGQRSEDMVFASNSRPSEDGWSFTLHYQGKSVLIDLPLFGSHNILNFLAASAAAISLELDLETIKKRALLIQPIEHRLEIRKTGNITIIDNSYNTNPTVSKSSLKLLKEYAGSQKILITPGLIELGGDAERQNLEFAKEAARVSDEIIIVGINARKALLKGLELKKFPAKNIHLSSSTQEAMNKLAQITKPDSVVLLENDLPDQYF